MISNFIWLNAIGPTGLLLLGVIPARLANRVCRPFRNTAQGLALLNVLLSFGWLAAVAAIGPMRSATLGPHGIGIAIYLDTLSAAMSALVSFVGLIVVRFSRNYLDGDPGQGRFIVRLCLTLASVLLVIVSGNLLQLAAAWIATSLGLHTLLIFYADRPAAHLAARKKFVVSRLGDLCLIGAIFAIYSAAGTLDTAAILDIVRQRQPGGVMPAGFTLAGPLLAAAALLKSAQFPTHGWLLEVMETPTPVSALLHAGIINAGGFLVLRYADLMLLSPAAMDTLTIVGGLTALFGSVVMLTQTSVKVSLAYSTIAQMGFMLLECGLGAFPTAFLHIVAHALYKAHAFLSSGSVIDIFRTSWSPSPGGALHPLRLAGSILIVGATAVALGAVLGVTVDAKPGVLVLTFILLLGLVHLIGSGIDRRPNSFVVVRTVALAMLVAAAYFALQGAADLLLAGSVPPVQPARGPFEYAMAGLTVLSFAALTLFQNLLPRRAESAAWAAIYAHIANGLYINTLANRWITRLWPAPPVPNPQPANHPILQQGVL